MTKQRKPTHTAKDGDEFLHITFRRQLKPDPAWNPGQGQNEADRPSVSYVQVDCLCQIDGARTEKAMYDAEDVGTPAQRAQFKAQLRRYFDHGFALNGFS